MTSPCTSVRPPLDAVVVEGQPLVVQAEQSQDGGVEIVDAGRVLGRLVADLVGGAVSEPLLQPCAGHPAGEDRADGGRGPSPRCPA